MCDRQAQPFLDVSDVFVTKLSPDGSKLVYSTFLGGNLRDLGTSIAVDASGAAYVTGNTTSDDFPTKNALQPRFDAQFTSAFVTKLTPDGSDLAWSTFLNGKEGSFSSGAGIAVDAAGMVYVDGTTDQRDFAVTPSAVQPACGNDGACGANPAFAGSIAAGSTTLTSASANFTVSDVGRGIVGAGIDVGTTVAQVVDGATVTLSRPASADSSRLHFAIVYPTYTDGASTADSTTYTSVGGNFAPGDVGRQIIGGYLPPSTTIEAVTDPSTVTLSEPATRSGRGLSFSVARDRQFGMSDSDVYVSELASDGSSLIYSTFLGGASFDTATGIALDASGIAYVTGTTTSSDFPTTSGAFEPTCVTRDCGASSVSFAAALAPGGRSLVYSTYLTAAGGVSTTVVAVDASGSAYLTGFTQSASFPTRNAIQPKAPACTDIGCRRTAFVTSLAPDGSDLSYSTYLGGTMESTGAAIAVDADGAAYVTGSTESSTDFPMRDPVEGRGGAFVTKITPAGSAVAWSTALGGSGTDRGAGIAVDATNSVYVAGSTTSIDFPLVNPAQATYSSAGLAGQNLFVAKIGPTDPAAPLVTGLTPRSGPKTGATPVGLSGSGFSGATGVSFGTVPAVSFSVDSDAHITAISPAQPSDPGDVAVTVTTAVGTSPLRPTRSPRSPTVGERRRPPAPRRPLGALVAVRFGGAGPLDPAHLAPSNRGGPAAHGRQHRSVPGVVRHSPDLQAHPVPGHLRRRKARSLGQRPSQPHRVGPHG